MSTVWILAGSFGLQKPYRDPIARIAHDFGPHHRSILPLVLNLEDDFFSGLGQGAAVPLDVGSFLGDIIADEIENLFFAILDILFLAITENFFFAVML